MKRLKKMISVALVKGGEVGMGDRELSDLYYEMVSGECETPEETEMDDE